MALGIFVTMLNEDSEHYNSNGTVIVKTPVWLDKPSYRLYKEENILVLRFLRNADGIDDINASTTQQEYIDKYIAINEQISNFAQTYPTNLKASSNEALLFMRRYRFANCSCFSCCFKDAYPSSNVQ